MHHSVEFQGHKAVLAGDEILWSGEAPPLVAGAFQKLWAEQDLGPGFGLPSSSLTSFLWCGVAFISKQGGRNRENIVLSTVKAFLQEVLVLVCGRIDGWAMAQPQPTLARMAETQPKGPQGIRRKRFGFFLQSQIAKKKKPRLSGEESHGGGSTTEQIMLREAQLHHAQVQKTYENVRFIEIVFDGSRFGGLETEIAVAYDMDADMAAFLPPQKMRELAWRVEPAGSHLEPAASDLFAPGLQPLSWCDFSLGGAHGSQQAKIAQIGVECKIAV